jgi:hypothetical protein
MSWFRLLLRITYIGCEGRGGGDGMEWGVCKEKKKLLLPEEF